jgi:hypothetical protein
MAGRPETEILPAATVVAAGKKGAELLPCSACGSPAPPGARYCKDCGADLTAPPDQSAAGSSWTAVVSADRDQHASFAPADVAFPPDQPPRHVPLTETEVVIGRGVVNSTDLGELHDPGISRLHASLLRRDDGAYELVDHGSTNGTRLNDEPAAIPPSVPVPLRAGDRIRVGAWTTITVRSASAATNDAGAPPNGRST